MLQRAVALGTRGAMFCVAMDACAEANLPEEVMGTRPPRWLLPASCLPSMTDADGNTLPAHAVRRRLRPDLLFIEGLTQADLRSRGGRPRVPLPEVKQRCKVHILEVGYVSDSSDRFLQKLTEKRQQHDALCTALRAAGWTIHGDGPHVLLLGVAGTIFNQWQHTLPALGVCKSAAVRLMHKLHTHALATACSINGTRLKLEQGTP